MPDVCAVCRAAPGKLCPDCRTGIDRQLRDLPTRYTALAAALAPGRSGPAEHAGTRVHAGLPVRVNTLSLIGPGGDVPPTLHPLVRYWQVKRTVQVTTPAGVTDVQATAWLPELVRDVDGHPIVVTDDDQVGTVPPREWLDTQVRAVRAHFGHHVPARTRPDRTGPYVPAVYRTLLTLTGGPPVIGFLAAAHRATGALERLAFRGLLAGRGGADVEHRSGPPRSMRWDVDYLRTWLDKAVAEDALDIATFAAQLRTLHAEISRALGDTPDETWVGRCPAFVAELGDDGDPTGRRKPCGAGLWQEQGAHLSAQVCCPRCATPWETRGHAGAGTAREIRRVWPVDRRRRYTADEIDQLKMPRCPGCGRRVTISWREVTGTRDPQRTWQTTGASCSNGCQEARTVV